MYDCSLPEMCHPLLSRGPAGEQSGALLLTLDSMSTGREEAGGGSDPCPPPSLAVGANPSGGFCELISHYLASFSLALII